MVSLFCHLKSRKRATGGVVRPKASRSCQVEQVPNLDYTEPAFQLEIAAGDDRSIVTFTYSVGTVPGGTDVVNSDEFSGPSAIISEDLKGGVPLYFTVTASNSAGGKSTATCQIPTYDVTLPVGRIEPAFRSTSNPRILEATSLVYEDSEIISAQLALGFGPGIWGDQIIPWTNTEKAKRTYNAGTNSALSQFSMERSGRLLSTPISKIKADTQETCATECLDSPHCLSFNYDFGESQECEILGEFEGPDVHLHQKGYFHHFERLGIGHAIEFIYKSLELTHNQLYYFNLQLINYVGYIGIVTSLPVITDFTPPEPGIIANISDDVIVHEPCALFTHPKWHHLCISDTHLENHRTIIDGPGSLTVFNGDTDMIELYYTRHNTYIAANWDGFHDSETGIGGYMWAVGTDICQQDIVNYTDPHSHIFHHSEWSHEGLEYVQLKDGYYYSSVRALNKIEFGGPMALTVCHSTPLLIDNTPPLLQEIYNITYNSNGFVIGVSVNTSDPDSALFSIHFALGETPRDVAHLDWIPLAPASFLTHIFEIPDGSYGWVKLRPVNNVDLRTVGVADYPILVDYSHPIAGEVFDGPIPGEELAFTKSRRQLCTNWRHFSDPESGISAYKWGIGSRPGVMDILDSVDISRSKHKYCGRVTLQHNVKYYATLTAYHGGNDKLNVTTSSNGVVVDLTPPEAGDIVDGLQKDYKDIDLSSEAATIRAQWRGYTDQESGIKDHKVSVYRKHADKKGISTDFEVIHAPESMGPQAVFIEWHHFHLHHKDEVYVALETLNNALASTHTRTDGYLVDRTAPKLKSLGDGDKQGQDRDFQTQDKSISVNWDFHDDESGIDRFELAIFEMRHGSKTKIFPTDTDSRQFVSISKPDATGYTQENLKLHQGATYTTMVKAINNVKLIASHETSGIKVDTTHPHMFFVRAGTLTGDEEELHGDYVYQSDKNGIVASWLAKDAESGIYSYWVTVISDVDQKHSAEYQAMGNDHDGYISGLNLELTTSASCEDHFTVECQPVYYVCAKAENGAGALSTVECSSPIRIVEEDKVGHGADGPGSNAMHLEGEVLTDIDAQLSFTTVTLQFTGFESQLDGLSYYEWAVGTEPGLENVQAFTKDGIVLGVKTSTSGPGLSGRGKAQSPLPLQHGQTYYNTIRAITGSHNVLETITDGFTVDKTKPKINILEFSGLNPIEVETVIYRNDDSMFTAMWNTSEPESAITSIFYQVGLYPGDESIQHSTLKNNSNIAASEVLALPNGVPNILSVSAINSVGLEGSSLSPTTIIDTTPPIPGKVLCPSYLSANGLLQCNISGFHDQESGISYCQFFVGTAEGNNDTYTSDQIKRCSYRFAVPELQLEHNKRYYVTVELTNAVNQRARAYSDAIMIDDTHPIGGVVVELSSEYLMNGTTGFSAWESVDCTSAEECLLYDASCLQSVSEIAIAWEPFYDPDTAISRYEIAIGTAPGNTDIKAFFEVSADLSKIVLVNLDMTDVKKVYASIRGYNAAGLSSIATSNGAYISRFGAGLPPLKPIVVRDGYMETRDSRVDLDFQTTLDQLSASWDFSGESCPIMEYHWAIYRIDGQVYQPWINVKTKTSGSSDGITMNDGETYFVVVKATNLLGYTLIYQSDGIEVKREPLTPGFVYDGDIIGRDLSYQLVLDTISASWNGFGNPQISETVKHTGNDEIQHFIKPQYVDHYEVAIGTDRRYPKTRDNIVSFTNVGQNKTVTFRHLSLKPLPSIYYVTVRAFSASFAKSEVTSNGISPGVKSFVTAGQINMDKYVNSLSSVNIGWSDFDSNIPMFFYLVGITDNNTKAMSLICDQVFSTQGTIDDMSIGYNVSPFITVDLDDYKILDNLNLTHGTQYYATVIGVDVSGKCNATKSVFTVDMTPPVEGRIRVGPYFDMVVSYTDSFEFITAQWEGYVDPESNIQLFNIRLLEAPSCTAQDENTLSVIIDWITLERNYTNYKLMDLDLQENKPYFVEVKAMNGAGSKITTRSSPILLDPTEPTPGFVVDGLNYKLDKIYHGDQHEISGSFLHYANPDGVICPQIPLPFNKPSTWDYLNSRGLWNMDGKDWDLQYFSEQIKVQDGTMTITLERDIQQEQMLSGAYVTSADILKGGKYTVDIKAASNVSNAITSIVFWNGPSDVLGEFDLQERGEERPEYLCSCCLVRPINESACWCNCTEFFILNEDMVNATLPPSLTEAPDANPHIRQMVSEDLEDYKIPQSACGLQLYSAGTHSKSTIWCRYYRDEYIKIQRTVPLDFDPAEDWHTYTLDIAVYRATEEEDQLRLSLFADDTWVSSLDGIPELSTSTRLAFHVWNGQNTVVSLVNAFEPTTVVANFRNLRIPPPISTPCRHGKPFRAGGSPIRRYLAGVGTAPGETDIIPFREILRPCIPCFEHSITCRRYECSNDCTKTAVVPLSFTLTNISLPLGSRKYFNDTSGTVATALYFVTVQAVAGNGKTCSFSSNGVNMDVTPPVLDFYFYQDVTRTGIYEETPVNYQASNNTIYVIWRFLDMESEIESYHWAIGSSPGSSDIQNFEFVGLNQTNQNNSLQGLLYDNQTYFVTVIARNGAGLETVYEFDGITVLLMEPGIDGVNTTVMFAESFPEEVVPSDAKRAINPHATGTCWTKADDIMVTRYDYCVGSSAEVEDDIVSCMPVGRNTSGCVSIINGEIVVTSDKYGEERFNISSFLPSDANGTFYIGSEFNMEPGKCLHTTLKVCNEASLCSILSIGTTTVVANKDEILTSSEGEDLEINTSDGRRRKRQVDNDFHLSIKSSGGMQQGESVVFGYINSDRAQEDYTSDATLNYKSYITNHLAEVIPTERILARRIQKVYETSFYLTSLGQMPLHGPLDVNITFPYWSNWTEQIPLLIYWNKVPDKMNIILTKKEYSFHPGIGEPKCFKDTSKWFDASMTCNDTGTSYEEEITKMILSVCSTTSPPSKEKYLRRSRRSVKEEVYFSHETQFAVVSLSTSIVNESPYFTNLDQLVIIDEDSDILQYQLEGDDPENDELIFSLDINEEAPTLGNANVSTSGLLTYKPCANCNGVDVVHLALKEVQFHLDIPPLLVQARMTIEIRSVNDNPVVFVASNGTIGSQLTRSAAFEVEENKGSNTTSLEAVLGAFDVDNDDVLIIQTTRPTHGTLILGTHNRSVPAIADQCNDGTNANISEGEWQTACGFVIPHDKDSLSWVLMKFTYIPHMYFIGEDSFRYFAKDKKGVNSQLMTVNINVYDPCVRSTCEETQVVPVEPINYQAHIIVGTGILLVAVVIFVLVCWYKRTRSGKYMVEMTPVDDRRDDVIYLRRRPREENDQIRANPGGEEDHNDTSCIRFNRFRSGSFEVHNQQEQWEMATAGDSKSSVIYMGRRQIEESEQLQQYPEGEEDHEDSLNQIEQNKNANLPDEEQSQETPVVHESSENDCPDEEPEYECTAL